MNSALTKFAINIIALFLVMHIMPGIKADTWQVAVVAALTLGLINSFLKPALVFFTLPLSIFSLGFFTLVINGFMFYMVSKLIYGFHIVNFWAAFWGALIFSIISSILQLFINTKGKINFQFYRYKPHAKARYRDVIDVEGKPQDG